MTVTLRKLRQGDTPFIFNSWLKSYRDSATVRSIPNRVYYEKQHRVIERLLESSVVYILCDGDNPDQILGYAVVDTDTTKNLVHWVYVKHKYRRKGYTSGLFKYVAAELGMDAKPWVFTHWSKGAEFFRDKYKDKVDIEYNPYLAWELL